MTSLGMKYESPDFQKDDPRQIEVTHESRKIEIHPLRIKPV